MCLEIFSKKQCEDLMETYTTVEHRAKNNYNSELSQDFAFTKCLRFLWSEGTKMLLWGFPRPSSETESQMTLEPVRHFYSWIYHGSNCDRSSVIHAFWNSVYNFPISNKFKNWFISASILWASTCAQCHFKGTAHLWKELIKDFAIVSLTSWN